MRSASFKTADAVYIVVIEPHISTSGFGVARRWRALARERWPDAISIDTSGARRKARVTPARREWPRIDEPLQRGARRAAASTSWLLRGSEAPMPPSHLDLGGRPSSQARSLQPRCKRRRVRCRSSVAWQSRSRRTPTSTGRSRTAAARASRGAASRRRAFTRSPPPPVATPNASSFHAARRGVGAGAPLSALPATALAHAAHRPPVLRARSRPARSSAWRSASRSASSFLRSASSASSNRAARRRWAAAWRRAPPACGRGPRPQAGPMTDQGQALVVKTSSPAAGI